MNKYQTSKLRTTTFEKLCYLRVNRELAQKIAKSCNVFRSPFENDTVIIQCCAKGYIDKDDLRRIAESHCGIIVNSRKVLYYINSNPQHKMLWNLFIKNLRLDV